MDVVTDEGCIDAQWHQSEREIFKTGLNVIASDERPEKWPYRMQRVLETLKTDLSVIISHETQQKWPDRMQ